jgi:hypothetical protein
MDYFCSDQYMAAAFQLLPRCGDPTICNMVAWGMLAKDRLGKHGKANLLTVGSATRNEGPQDGSIDTIEGDPYLRVRQKYWSKFREHVIRPVL